MKNSLVVVLLCLGLPVHAACWRTVTAPGSVRFIAEQAGAALEGQFTGYSATVCLPEAGNTGSITAELDTASVDSGLPELDTELRGPLFFDVSKWPKAHLLSQSLSLQGDGNYLAVATLNLRDKTRPIEIRFQFRPDGGGAQLSASLELHRLDYDIGLGEWQATDWVADTVKVEIRANLQPVAAHAAGTSQ